MLGYVIAKRKKRLVWQGRVGSWFSSQCGCQKWFDTVRTWSMEKEARLWTEDYGC